MSTTDATVECRIDSDVPADFETWPSFTEEWSGQQRWDAPEEYGTITYYRRADGLTVADQTTVQPCDWYDPMDGQLAMRAGTSRRVWVSR